MPARVAPVAPPVPPQSCSASEAYGLSGIWNFFSASPRGMAPVAPRVSPAAGAVPPSPAQR